MDRTEIVKRIVSPSLDAMGYEVVRVQFQGNSGRKTLQVMVERTDRAGMTVDDCAEVSRAISAVLDLEDPIPSSYLLEVSSPGIDRPLVQLSDYERFQGMEATVETRTGIEGRKRFKGTLAGVRDQDIVIEMDGVACALHFDDISRAKLVLTDALIAAHQQSAEGAGSSPERSGSLTGTTEDNR